MSTVADRSAWDFQSGHHYGLQPSQHADTDFVDNGNKGSAVR